MFTNIVASSNFGWAPSQEMISGDIEVGDENKNTSNKDVNLEDDCKDFKEDNISNFVNDVGNMVAGVNINVSTTNTCMSKYLVNNNHLGGDPVVRAWDQEVCSLCGLRFEPCGCSYDGHWRLTWSLTSGPVGLVEVRASWPGHPS